MAKINWDARFQYKDRAQRAQYISCVFADFLNGDVLDVGCSGAALRSAVQGSYVGIDIVGSPDVFVDLEGGVLPFADSSFDCIVCSDVLEHVDNFHSIFDEFVRVSRHYIVLSLPNSRNYETLVRIIALKPIKFYGLPSGRPDDRHKWFFGYSEAESFLSQRAQMHALKILAVYPHMLRYTGFKGWLILFLVRLLSVTSRRYRELGSMALWGVLEKSG